MPEYAIRLGLALRWGAAPAIPPTETADAFALLTFVLAGDSARRDERMLLRSARAHRSPERHLPLASPAPPNTPSPA